LNFASAGPAFPESYTHEDGATYRGQWNGLKKHGVGVYKSSSRCFLLVDLNISVLGILVVPLDVQMVGFRVDCTKGNGWMEIEMELVSGLLVMVAFRL
jgi:hypothetical protein